MAGLAAAGLSATGLALLFPVTLPAQEPDSIRKRIEESEQRLERIRAERRTLRREMDRLAEQLSTGRQELRNIERQIGSSASVVAELDVQLDAVRSEVDRATRDMIRTRDRLTVRKIELRERLRELYKRGPLGPTRALLAARSFSDLINRYKYLRVVTLYDRMLVRQVSQLETRLEEQRAELAGELRRLQRLRAQKEEELADLEELERQRQRRLARVRGRESEVESAVTRLARRQTQEEQRLRSLLAELERARRAEERRTGRASTSTLRTSDLGNLNWPVEGEVVYGYGPEREGTTTIRREGVGIAARPGSPVRVVESGTVEWAGPRGSYGPSVVVSHGGGYYSVYLYLRDLRVEAGESVDVGQVLGGVGGSASRDGPHAEFQIWEPSTDGDPRTVDPVRWLRERG